MNKQELKDRVCRAIVEHRAEIEAVADSIFAEPELGFKEVKTSRKVQEARSWAFRIRTAGPSPASRGGLPAGAAGAPWRCSANSTPSSAAITSMPIR